MSNPLISVVVCTYNREKFINNCLQSLKNQSLAQQNFEVLVVDNNSKDRSAEIIKEFIALNKELPFFYYHEANQGLSFARNRGIKEAKGTWITYIDDDAEADVDFLKNLKLAIETYRDAVGFGGKILPNYVDSKPDWMTSYVEGAFASKLDRGEKIGVFGKDISGFPIGCNMTYTKEILKKIGGFNPQLGRLGNLSMAGEEKHVFTEILAEGRDVVYLPNVTVNHVVEQYRLRVENLISLSYGIGASEKIRTVGISRSAYLKKLFEVLFKSLASVFILIIYSITGEYNKGKYVYLFRHYILLGFLKYKT